MEAIFDGVLRITDSVSYLDALTLTQCVQVCNASHACVYLCVYWLVILCVPIPINADHVYFSHMCCIKNGQPFQYKGPANSTVVGHLA